MKPAAIFLDFDGPLLNWRSNLAGLGADPVLAALIQKHCARLRLDGVRVNVVVSSSHRLSGIDHCREILEARCAPHPLWTYVDDDRWRIDGADWDSNGGSIGARAANIQLYAQAHGIEPRDCIAIDDYDMRPLLPAGMIQALATPEGLPYPEMQRFADWADRVRRES